MDAIDRKLAASVKKYRKIADATPEPGTHKQTAGILEEIRRAQDALLDEKLSTQAEAEALLLEEAFSAS